MSWVNRFELEIPMDGKTRTEMEELMEEAGIKVAREVKFGEESMELKRDKKIDGSKR